MAIASRAFAAYDCAQCLIALRASDGAWRKLGYGTLAAAMAAIALLAQPAD